MKKLTSMLTCLIGLFALIACSEDEEVMTGNISGLVTSYTDANTAIAGATVTLNNKGLTKTTGSDGRFEFPDLEPGTYTLAVAANGFQATTKQVQVYAGENAMCDFQLQKSSSNVEITPQTLAFGTENNQLSFTIQNNNSRSMQYSITGYPSYISVTPSSATVASMAKQTIVVQVNRNAITQNVSTSLIVNIGNDSYPVSVTVNHNSLSSEISVTPSVLDFGKNYTELQFTIKNVSTAGDISWTIDPSTATCLSVSPKTGVTAMGKSTNVTVSLDRSIMNADLQSFLNINAAGGSTSVQVTATKSGTSGGGEEEPGGAGEVTNGLYAYFNFNGNLQNQTENELPAVGIGTSFVNSFNGTQALKIPSNNALLSIPEGLVDQRRMSVSFWVKDLTDGMIFHVIRTQNDEAFRLAMDNGRLKFVVTNYDCSYSGGYSRVPSFLHGSLEGWHMITLVSDFNETTYATITTQLYVDGVYTDMITEEDNPFGEGESGDGKNYNAGIKFILGGKSETNSIFAPATTLILDNLRVYKHRKLTSEEIKKIYNYERN